MSKENQKIQHMELAKLHREKERFEMENAFLKKRLRTSRKSRSEVRND